MDGTLKALFDTGRKILGDTKAPRPAHRKSKVTKEEIEGVAETDPHKNFIKRTIAEKPKKPELIKDIKRFIEQAEQEL